MPTTIAKLPDEVLGEIMLLGTGNSVEGKFAVAQVTNRWRAVALGSPLLWTSFRLETRADWFRLPIVLERSGNHRLLDVDVDPCYDCRADMAILAPHAARFHDLHVDVSRNYRCLSPLFDGDLDFDGLRTLRVISGNITLSTNWTPALRILHLENARLMEPIDIYGPHIKELVFFACPRLQASDILQILVDCPNLVRLVFHSYATDINSLAKAAPVPPDILAPSIRSLDLGLSLAEMLLFLKKGFSEAVLPDISVCIDDKCGDFSEVVGQLWDALLRGLDPIISFEAAERARVVLRDAAGRVRSLAMTHTVAFWPLDNIWKHLSAQHSINTSVLSLAVHAQLYLEFCAAVAECPMQDRQHGVSLRFVIDESDDFVWDASALEIDIPGLDCVQLDNRTGSLLCTTDVVSLLRPLRRCPGRTIQLVFQGVSAALCGEGLDQFQMTIAPACDRSHG